MKKVKCDHCMNDFEVSERLVDAEGYRYCKQLCLDNANDETESVRVVDKETSTKHISEVTIKFKVSTKDLRKNEFIGKVDTLTYHVAKIISGNLGGELSLNGQIKISESYKEMK